MTDNCKFNIEDNNYSFICPTCETKVEFNYNPNRWRWKIVERISPLDDYDSRLMYCTKKCKEKAQIYF